ncbi:MAG: DUF3570 domain-containing protein [Proteobacteria bacterium]|nr:DUF3570 domain-containing protein [Pseudomonadota bacterium]
MAATEQAPTPSSVRPAGALRALTAAALALPGLMGSQGFAADDGSTATLDYHHYAEGERDLEGRTYKSLNLRPIEVDSLALAVRNTLADRWHFALNYTQDTWSGATPVLSLPQAAINEQMVSGASVPLAYLADSKHRPQDVDPDSFDGRKFKSTEDQRLVHLMASASPETRRQVDGRLDYGWDRASFGVGGGVSEEPDYHSGFLNTGGSFDFEHKRTTLTWGASYTVSNINASLDANAAADWGAYLGYIRESRGHNTLFGQRHDVGASLSVTHVINKNSLVEAGMGYTRSSGYLENPYKATMLAFDDPDQFIDASGLRTVQLRGVLEQRPGSRDQFNWHVRYVDYIAPLDAALHADYRFFHDDWGIDAHTINLSWHQPLGGGWMLIPGARYYSQSRADFYAPYFLFNQAYPALPGPIFPGVPRPLDFSKLARRDFSSDARLSGFGSIGGELAVSREFSKGAKIEIGADYSVHAGALKLGDGGEKSFADVDSYVVYATLSMDLSAPALASGLPLADAAEMAPVRLRRAPAGVQWDHLLAAQGDMKVGYHFDYDMRGNGIQHGGRRAGDTEVITRACENTLCSLTPRDSDTHVSTVDFMLGLSPRATMIVGAAYVNHDIALRDLDTNVQDALGIIPPPRVSYTRSAGGLGDVSLHFLYGLFETSGHEVHAGLGISAPTGSVEQRLAGSRDFSAYDTQLGSGTWDFHPSLTYSGELLRFAWGTQLSGTKRMEASNDAGYRLGDRLQATTWGSVRLADWLSASIRGQYTNHGGVHGRFDAHAAPQLIGTRLVGAETQEVYQYVDTPSAINGPMDSADSSGGQWWDVGFGVNAVVPSGLLRGNRVSVEWLEPMADHFNGYQLERQGSLQLRWELSL